MKKFAGILIILSASLNFHSVARQIGDTSSVKTTAVRLDKYLASASKLYKFNGLALVAEKGRILLQKGYGFKNVK